MRGSVIARGVLVTALTVLGASAPVAPPTEPPRFARFDPDAVEETLSAGFQAIATRYLDDVPAALIGLEGMRGLDSVDPALTVTRADRTILLETPGRVVARYPAPPDDDARGWAALALTVATESGTVSHLVRDADAETLYQAVFDATLSRLDRFSRYAGAGEAREHRANRNGFGGLGLVFAMVGGQASVTQVLPDTPAALAGLTVGDMVTRVDGDPVAGLDRQDLSLRLRGPVDSDIVLTVVSRGRPAREVRLRRALVVPQTVSLTLKGGVAEIAISGFNQRTGATLAQALRAARATLGSGFQGVVLDLRGNPGGLLDQAVEAADLFIARGPILSTRGRHPDANQSYEAHAGEAGEDVRLVVLVDGRSASAAEILAGALEDSGRAVLVGTTTYGKGTVQTVVRLPNDGEITLTWSRFYTPSGYALHGLGVPPTLCTAVETAGVGDVLADMDRPGARVLAAALLAQWRATGPNDIAARTRLRAFCPPVRHADSPLDMAVAERLLGDPALYARALALAAPDRSLAEDAIPVAVIVPGQRTP